MLVRSDPRPPTGTVLRVPRALAHGVLPSGLTAPALRAFIVLLAHADAAGSIDMLKPLLVEHSGTRIDAASRFLEPLRATTMATAHGHALDGEPWFDDVTYAPGERTKFAGVVKTTLSPAARTIMAQPDLIGSVEIQVDEFRRLNTVPGIILYLRLRDELAQAPKARSVTMRAVVEDLHGLFGIYCAAAASKRVNADGEVEMSLGLSRVTATLLRPAVADVARAIDGYAVDLIECKAEGAGRGVRWRHVDIVAERLAPKRTMKDLGAAERERKAHAGRIGRTRR